MRTALLALAILLAGCPTDGDDDDATLPDDDDTPDFGDDDDDVADDDDSSGDDDDVTGDDDDATAGALTLDEVLAVLSTSADDAELDTLIRDVGWGAGWPMQDGDRWLFATRWEGSQALSVVGDINGWDPATHPATRSATFSHWYAVIDANTFAVPAAGAKYKWTDTATWSAGFEATAYFWDSEGRFGYVAPPSDAAWAEQFPDLVTDALPLPRSLRLLFPPGFQPGMASAASSRTLLMHDGQNLFDPDAFGGGWQMDQLLAADPAMSDVVLVGVDNTADRLDVYSHVADDIFENGTAYGGRADDYLDLIDNVALPFVRERYGLVADGANLMVAGSSMGGLVSLYMAREWDGTLGCVGALSPSLFFGAIDADGTEALVNLWPTDPGHGQVPIFLYSGGSEFPGCVDHDSDGVVELSGDQDNYCVTTQFRDMLADGGYVFESDLWHWHVYGAQHVEPAWRAQVPRMLTSCAASGWSAP
ncbi:MAG: hypothetical protein KDA24_22880 [Deltaproteobacteria bacterium]|nr:hypothetical protein [Deltaproteobacteria bacterium]